MAKILKPKRGAINASSAHVLAEGELFLQYGDTNDSNGPGKIYIGNGTATVNDLTPFIQDPSFNYLPLNGGTVTGNININEQGSFVAGTSTYKSWMSYNGISVQEEGNGGLLRRSSYLYPNYLGFYDDNISYNSATYNSQGITAYDRSVSYVEGAKGKGSVIFVQKPTNLAQWYPAITLESYGGGSWQIGNYDNENLQFVYFSADKISGQINEPVIASLGSGGGTIAYTTSTVDNANKLGGYSASASTTANSICQRTANGYIEAVYFNQKSSAEATASTDSCWMYCNSDGYLRKSNRLNTAKALTNSSLSAANYVVGLTNNWAAFGHVPIYSKSSSGHLDWDSGGAGSIVTKGTMAYWNGRFNASGSNLNYCVNGTIVGSNSCVGNQAATTNTNLIYSRVPFVTASPGIMDIGQYIDFHLAGSNVDYSTRIYANSNGGLSCSGNFSPGSSRKIKKNIEDISQEEADKILLLRPVKFDYKRSSKNDQEETGFIAEEVYEIYPKLTVPEEGEEGTSTFNPMGLKYEEMIPYLVKVCQRQQNEIDELKAKLELLEK